MTPDPRDVAAWKAQVAKERRGVADPQRLNAGPSGLGRKLLYTSADVAGLPESLPGSPPYTRGVRASMYTGRPWTVRQYAGFSGPEDSNAFYHQQLASGYGALSVAFDLPTQRGYDSDHPLAAADVGQAGVAIDSVEDMARLFAGIALDEVSVSMTINGAALPILAAYIVAAQEQGALLENLAGTVQNDILKEFTVRNTYIYPPQPSMRVVGDIIAWVTQHMPRFNPVSISGYHLQEAGAGTALELGYTLASGLEYLRAALDRGLEVDQFAPRLSFFFGVGMDFYAEIAKLRAARTLWAEVVGQFGPKNPQSQMLRTHTQTSGWSLTQQEPYNNIIRTTIEALAAVFGGTQSLHTNAFDEAVGLPTDFSARLARNTQLILAHETGIAQVVDPWGGSYLMERLTADVVAEARKVLDEIEGLGGMTAAVAAGLPKARIEEAAARRQVALERGDEVVVGVNRYRAADGPVAALERREIDHAAVYQAQLARLRQLRAQRDQAAVTAALAALAAGARSGENLLPLTITAMRLRATVGEVSAALEGVWGRHQPLPQVASTAYVQGYAGDPLLAELQAQVRAWAAAHGRVPRLLLTKLGQDGHDRGAKVVASGFAAAGFLVLLAPLFQTPQEAAAQAQAEGADVVGVSSLAAGHRVLVPQLLEALRGAPEAAKDSAAKLPKVIVGGIVPPDDHAALYKAGVAGIYGPGQPVLEAVREVLALL